MRTGDLPPRKEFNVLNGQDGAVFAARFNGHSNYCPSCDRDRTIRLWNPQQDIQMKFAMSTLPFDVHIIVTFSDSVMSVCLTKAEIIGGRVDGTVRTFDFHIGSCTIIYKNTKATFVCKVTSVSYHLSPKENFMITASVDGTIRVWMT